MGGQGAGNADVEIRDATPDDAPAIQVIYAHHVTTGLASFEEEAPAVADMIARQESARVGGYPYLVAVRDGAILGYAYASSYRPRRAYRYTVEDSVYVGAELAGQGIGSALLAALIARCEAGPLRQMIAVIGNSGNAGSIALHRRFGFTDVGVLRSVGFKHGQWVDTVLMQRSLGVGKDIEAEEG